MHRLTEEPRYDEATQRQILTLAAELQRYGQEGATLAELEAKAKEAGIDPTYLKMAMGHVMAPATPPMPVATPVAEKAWYQNNEITLVAVLVFTGMQIFTIPDMMQTGIRQFPVALLFAPILGLAFSRNTAHRLGALAVLFGSTVMTALLTLMVHKLKLTGNTLSFDWPRAVVLTFIAEFIALMFGFTVAAITRWIRGIGKRLQ